MCAPSLMGTQVNDAIGEWALDQAYGRFMEQRDDSCIAGEYAAIRVERTDARDRGTPIALACPASPDAKGLGVLTN